MKDEREVKLISRRASDIELPERKKRWGKFYLKGKYTLSCKTGLGRYEYPIYLDRIKSGNQCVDVIFQVTSKTWLHGAGLQGSARRSSARDQSARTHT